jgi:hypothetical protein
MSRLDINAVRREALFASTLQRSDAATEADIRLAISRTVRALGSRGCAERVAQEFGDHPECAAARMLWVRQLVDRVPPPVRPRAPRIASTVGIRAQRAA